MAATTTPINGAEAFPADDNRIYTAINTIASQNIRAVKNTNTIEDAFYEYPIENGKIIQEAIIKMAEAQAFTDTGAPDLSPTDPELQLRYFNNWENKQFRTTTRRAEIRAILASNRGETEESVTAGIMDTLTQGEGNYDYGKERAILADTSVGCNASTELFGGKTPANMKGVLTAVRVMFNALVATNQLSTFTFKQSCPVEDARIAISKDLLAYIDVVELANLFNLDKAELEGKLVKIPHDADWPTGRVVVYDRKAYGRGTRLYEYSQDNIGASLYINHYLTTERCYFYNPLYKQLYLDCTTALNAANGELFTGGE